MIGALVAALLSVTLLLSTSLAPGIGAPAGILLPEGVSDVQGYLAGRQDYHYLGLHVEKRFASVQLTLTVHPVGAAIPAEQQTAGQDDAQIDIGDTINFLILTELGLQRFLNGADPWEVNLTAGTPAIDDEGVLRLHAGFRAMGRGGYTILVYNPHDTPAAYHLRAEGGLLIDHAGQTHPTDEILPVGQSKRGLSLDDLAAERFGRTQPTLTALPVAALGRPAALPVRAHALGGLLTTESTRHYFVLEPTAHNGEMTLSLAFAGAFGSAPAGAINYWVFTEAGVRQLDQGAPAELLSLASGAPFLGVPNLLRTRVRLTGETAYAVVVFNETQEPINYRLRVDGGELVDLYGQSDEALAQLEALTDHPPANDLVAPLFPEMLLPPGMIEQLEDAPAQGQNAGPAHPDEETEAVQPENTPGNNEQPAPEADGSPPQTPAYRLPLFQTDWTEAIVLPLITRM